ncbi:MAG: hypothetical protein IKZ34_02835 [Alphaproteobacteria bacterium]|nr:hypothetical protein [Alphaproteobacteria bacterium]
MFGISWSEFFVIVIVAVLIIPSRLWPDVARFLAKTVNFVRQIIWKITDASENIKQQIELEKPIDDLVRSTTNDMIDSFSSVIPKKNKKKTVKKTVKKKASK